LNPGLFGEGRQQGVGENLLQVRRRRHPQRIGLGGQAEGKNSKNGEKLNAQKINGQEAPP